MKDDLGRILVTGGTGLIGRNLVERLEAGGASVLGVGSEVDLRFRENAEEVIGEFDPTLVVHLAARVGGIQANNTQKPGFYSDNVLINTHVVNAASGRGVPYILAMGTGCGYPKRLEGRLLPEETFLDGEPEPTNDAYAYAKRGMLVHLESLRQQGRLDFGYCIPANIYGAYDNFHPVHSHVVPGLIRRFVEARNAGTLEVAIWGDGEAKRDFLHIDDCIDAMMLLLQTRFSGPVNVATGQLTSIRELAETIAEVCGYEGRIRYDRSMPSGQRERVFHLEKIRRTGWSPKVALRDGLSRTVAWFEANANSVRER